MTTKSDQITAMLRRPEGCTRPELLAITGWKDINVRGYAQRYGMVVETKPDENGPLRYFGREAATITIRDGADEPVEDDTRLGSKLWVVRNRLKMTQRELADRAGYPREIIAAVEDNRETSPDIIVAIFDALRDAEMGEELPRKKNRNGNRAYGRAGRPPIGEKPMTQVEEREADLKAQITHLSSQLIKAHTRTSEANNKLAEANEKLAEAQGKLLALHRLLDQMHAVF